MLTYSSALCFYNYKQSASCWNNWKDAASTFVDSVVAKYNDMKDAVLSFLDSVVAKFNNLKDVVTTKVIEPSNELNSVVGGNISYCCCIPFAFGAVKFVALQVLSTFLPSFIAGHFATLIALQLVPYWSHFTFGVLILAHLLLVVTQYIKKAVSGA